MIKRIVSFILAVVMAVGLGFMAPVHVHAATEMDISETCIRYLQNMEGFTAIPYWDYSQWTVGFGNRCPDADLERYQKEGIPIAEAEALYAQQLSGFVKAVNNFVSRKGLALKQREFDALVCLAYNKGGAWMYKDNDPLVIALVNGYTGNDMIAALTISVLTSTGEYLPGLTTRRLSEANMFLNGVYSTKIPGNYCHVLFDANGGTKNRTAQGYDCNLPAAPVATATYDGYTFLGWYTAAEGGTKVTALDATHNGMTLYAHWGDGTEGDDSGGSSEPVQTQLVTVTTSVLNVRTGPGTSYSLAGSLTKDTQVAITAVQEVGGIYWGQYSGGWICLSYTDYDPNAETETPEEPEAPETPETPEEPETPETPSEPPQEEKPVSTLPEGLPLVGTVVGTDELAVYNGPHSSYPQIATLAKGEKVTITETYEMFGTVWGLCEKGWVRTTRNILFEGYTALAHSFTATVTESSLNIRTGPSTSYSKISTAYKGEMLQITAVLVIDSENTWGLSDRGWLSLVNTNYDSAKLSYYQSHSYGDWHKYSDPSCSQQGQNRRDCEHCDHYEVQLTGYLSHTYGPWEDSVAASCAQQGQQQRSCTVCGHKETRSTGLGGHSCGVWETVTEATCTQTGRERRDCANCDYYETQIIPVRAHNYGQWTTTLEPTDSTVGQARRDCADCDHYELKELPVTEHIFGSWSETKTPTCTAEGEAVRYCSHCDHSETKTLPATGHSLGDWQLVKAATCSAEGQERRCCADCDYQETRSIAKTNHSYGQWSVHTAPGCTTEGQERRTCSCGHYESRTVAAAGHSLGEWYEYTAATYTTEGEKRRDCAKCDHYETDTIPCKEKPAEKTYGTLTGYSFLRIRTGAGTGYSAAGQLSYGDRVEILEQKQVGSTTWGKISQGWICLTGYMTLETVTEETEKPSQPDTPSTVTKTYGTLTGYSFLNIRSGAGTGYALAGKLYYGERVEILEQKQVGGVTWGKISQGWICLTGYMTLETVTEETEKPSQPDTPSTVTKTYGTLTGYSFLNIRSGAGTGYALAGKLYYGERVEILEQKQVGGVTWGKISQGWICLTGYMTLETVTEQSGTTVKPNSGSEQKSMTVTAEHLNIRAGAGTSYGIVGGLKKGKKVVVLEEKVVGNRTWVRIDQGWVCKDYLE